MCREVDLNKEVIMMKKEIIHHEASQKTLEELISIGIHKFTFVQIENIIIEAIKEKGSLVAELTKPCKDCILEDISCNLCEDKLSPKEVLVLLGMEAPQE